VQEEKESKGGDKQWKRKEVKEQVPNSAATGEMPAV
jgi:hypothetical protein